MERPLGRRRVTGCDLARRPAAFVATIADPHAFKSGRCLSAWIGLVPKQNSGGGKERHGSISTQWPSSAMPSGTEPSGHGSCK